MSRKCGFFHVIHDSLNGFLLCRYDGLIIAQSSDYNYIYKLKKSFDSSFVCSPDDSQVISAPIVCSFGG